MKNKAIIDLTEEELYERFTELNKRVVWASRYGSSDLYVELQRQYAMLQQEKDRRLYMMPKIELETPVVIETDPDMLDELRSGIQEKQQKEMAQIKEQRRVYTRERIKATLQPPTSTLYTPKNNKSE